MNAQSSMQCYIMTLAIAWNSLGVVGGGNVGGQQYTKQRCYVRALEIDDQHAKPWNSLGVAELRLVISAFNRRGGYLGVSRVSRVSRVKNFTK